MTTISRRAFMQQAASLTIAGAALTQLAAEETPPRKMTIDLVCGAIGVSANPRQAIDLAARHGFESVEANGGYLASLTEEQLTQLKDDMKSKKLVFGASGLPVEFRQSPTKFEEGVKGLPKFAAGLQRAGVTRVSTWLSPGHPTLTYIQNFKQHTVRLKEVAKVLGDSGIRLGLEYVGPKTSWSNSRYPFIHTMAEMKDLIAAIGLDNVGFLLDSWHWWHAGDTEADILSLKGPQVVAVDLNDAPAGIPKDQQVDSRRELPCATGVIKVGVFLNALNRIGYDGPVRAEPFNKAVNSMTPDEACAAAASALKKAFALIEPA